MGWAGSSYQGTPLGVLAALYASRILEDPYPVDLARLRGHVHGSWGHVHGGMFMEACSYRHVHGGMFMVGIWPGGGYMSGLVRRWPP